MNPATTVQAARRPLVVAGITPYSGTFGKEQLLHLLKRTMFGAKKADIDFFAGKTMVQVVDALLTDPAADAPHPVNNYGNAIKPDPITPLGDTWVYNTEDGNFNGERRSSTRSWWGGLMINQQRTIFEKMMLFWHNHFATESIDTTALLGYWHLVMLRKNTLGNFKTFVKEVTFDPHMLRYLNGYLNSKVAPDENYGRELQELFTLGKGADSQYTEGDVKAAARILTGWRIKTYATPTTGKSIWYVAFDPNTHDTGLKVFSSFYGSKNITGNTATANTEANARREIDEMIEMIFASTEVAKFMCRKLYSYFIYYEIDATAEANVITPLADLFRASNYDIKPVLKALLTSEHFFDAGNKACLIKSPIDYTVGAVREFNIEFPVAADYILQYGGWNNVVGERNNGASIQGQNLGNPPNVAGWPAYYQVPVFHEYWINTDSFPRRVSYIDKFLTNTGIALGTSVLGGTKTLIVDVLKFADGFGIDASDPVKLIDLSLELLYRVPVTTKFKQYLKNILLSGQSSDYYWTDAWDAYKTSPTTTNINIVKSRLQTFYKLIVDQPDYHLS